MKCLFLGIALLAAALWVSVSSAEERDPLQPRVPADKLQQVKKEKNPLPATPENIQKGKAIFEGKGTCFICHGMEGKGDGPAAVGFDPSPRNFINPAFQAVRADGELMYVLKNGSPGTAMMPMLGSVITEEEGWLVLLYIRSLVKK
jgi:mono/diheme cytochrome c family protein